jgi:hypothetical protein
MLSEVVAGVGGLLVWSRPYVLGWLLWVIVVAEMVCGVEGEFWFGSGWAVTLSR